MITAPNFEEFDWLVHGFGLRDSPAPAELTTVKQIHSDIVLEAAGRRGQVVGEGDALISNRPGVTVGVKTADCVPILLVDPSLRVVASIHAGWRGTAQNIVAKSVRHLSALWKTQPGNLRAAIGPSIGGCCYEVGADVAGRFAEWEPGLEGLKGPVHLDLRSINERQLRAEGVSDIWKSGECTFCRADRFFSYRREREQAGRMVSFIGQ